MADHALPRLLIAGGHRSSGKTMVGVGLCAALREAGATVQPFKKGPDFIDPMWLTLASGRACRTLDIFFMGDDGIVPTLAAATADADFAIIEGNIGLHDGVDPEGSDSSAALARCTGTPVLLVIDCRGITRGIAPLLLGLRDFEPDVGIAGVLLNQVGNPRHEAKLRAAIERYVGMEVLGILPKLAEAEVRERHLGITPVAEERRCREVVARLAQAMRGHVDLARLRSLAASAPPLAAGAGSTAPPPQQPAVRIGIARDAAFTFYYPENLEALRRAGGELVPFSPMADCHLPEVDGLYIGGGFPEFHAAALTANATLRQEIFTHARAGLPIYAECGGLMYLSRAIHWHGTRAEMTGVLPCEVALFERAQGAGYVRLEPTDHHPWRGEGEVRAHEFHHSKVVELEPVPFAYRVARGKGIDGHHEGMVVDRCLATYAHLHAAATPDWAERFVAYMRRCRG
ncbi:MAG TPA: cobyrinate a,c-diamide synthase [bacterium]